MTEISQTLLICFQIWKQMSKCCERSFIRSSPALVRAKGAQHTGGFRRRNLPKGFNKINFVQDGPPLVCTRPIV
ncbi:MAG: hypothetical protein CBB71_06505 [Rhodopirellula sp. TMED11]|nr:MAG: hypothetical protein CBB71_06505 [Rhodopirellula sp. TMED11]